MTTHHPLLVQVCIGVILGGSLGTGCSKPAPSVPKLTVGLSACLGAEESGCQAQLKSLAGSRDAGCFLLYIGRELQLNTAVRWRDSGLDLITPPEASLEVGETVQVALYLSAGAEQITCDEIIGADASCDAVTGCAVKLLSPVTEFTGDEITLDFRTLTNLCNIESVSASLPAEQPDDGIDNDCNGEVDEVEAEPCLDACGDSVALSLNERGELECVPPELVELCSVAGDEDCDGEVDEGFELNGVACNYDNRGPESGVLVCDNQTNRDLICVPVSSPPECVPQSETTSLALCDGKDNDCDTRVDEEFPTDGILIPDMGTCGSGSCSAEFRSFCNGGERVTECRPSAQERELCDGLDNDCDGVVDNDTCPPDEDTKERAQCRQAQGDVWACEFAECFEGFGPEYDPMTEELLSPCGCEISVEICDNRDNDCDGVIDETGDTILRDVCDSIDEDCDGLLDEGRDSGISGYDCSIGEAWRRRCEVWFDMFRKTETSTRMLSGKPETNELTRLNFSSIADNIYRLKPIFMGEGDNDIQDRLIPHIECVSPLPSEWINWVNRSCRATVIWNGRDGIDPWSCQDSDSRLSDHCSHSLMSHEPMVEPNDVRAPSINASVESVALGVTCRIDPNAGDRELERLRLSTFMNNYSFQIGLFQNVDSDFQNEVLCSFRSGSYGLASCGDASGVNLNCGDQELEVVSGSNQVTRWSTLNGYDMYGLCAQPLFGSYPPLEPFGISGE